MEKIKRLARKLGGAWKRIPATIRKPIVFVIGGLFIIAAGLTGWLPGPGGIPLFLIGVAILSTEFEWALRLREKVLAWIKDAGHWIRLHKLLGGLLIVLGLAFAIGLSTFIYRQLN